MIVGIGIDLIENDRILKMEKLDSFIDKYFTKEEQTIIKNNNQFAVDNFVCKEAIVKMLGTGFNPIEPKDIEILRDEKGKPFANLYNKALQIQNEQNINNIHLSITNTYNLTNAVAIGECFD